MSETLIVPLGGDVGRASAAVERALDAAQPVVFPLSQLANGGRAILREHSFDQLAVVGAPPRDEIGYSLAALVACLGRPRRVALVDVRADEGTSQSLAGYLASTAPFAAWQLLASGVALAAQGASVPLARQRRFAPGASELGSLVYLRPAVGSTSGVGGSVTHAHEVIRALAAEGVDVRAFTTDERIAETARRDPNPPCNWHAARTPRVARAIPASAAAGGDAALVLAALSSARSSDAIYQRHARFSLSGALLARLTGRPLIVEFNGSEVYFGRYWNPTPFRNRLARCEDAVLAAASLVVVVSESDRRSLAERGVDPGRIVVNPNGVDASRFAAGGGADVRAKHRLAEDDFVVGFVGTFGSWHGAPVLARAFAAAAAELPAARLLLVGEGPELEQTLSLLASAGVDDRVTFTGAVDPSKIPAHLDACDVLASPHVPLAGGVEFFGSPTKLFEYMAAGKAIVASRLGQIAETLADGETALLVEPSNVEELGAALVRLSREPELRRELGAKARRVAIDRHSWREGARRLREAYRRLQLEAIA